jgi:hypothetical protein
MTMTQAQIARECELRRAWLDRVGAESAAYHARSRSRGASPGVRCYHDFTHDPADPVWAPSDVKWAEIEAHDTGQTTVDTTPAEPSENWEPAEVGTLPQYPGWQA